MRSGLKLIILVIALLIPSISAAYSIVLEWTARPADEEVVKYNVYMNGKLKTTVTTNTATIIKLSGVNTFYVTAVNKHGLEGPKVIPISYHGEPGMITTYTISVKTQTGNAPRLQIIP